MKQAIKFGTDGIRGNASSFPFTNDSLSQLGRAIAYWAREKYENASAVIAYDTRESSNRINETLSKTLISYGVNVYDAQVLPTPAVLQIIRNDDRFTFGIMISASHNHYTDNGIKIFDSMTGKLSPADELIIEENFLKSYPEPKSSGGLETLNLADNFYKAKLTEGFSPQFLKGLNIVLDCANGATFKIAPEVFKALGANLKVISNTPNGQNINQDCGALATAKLKQTLVSLGYDFGFAFDGDGDRVIAINRNGEIRDGDDLLAILLEHPGFSKTTDIVGTIMTNHGLGEHLKAKNKALVRTKVGDKYVSAKLQESGLLIGGETSGHIILNNYLPTGDGIFAALKVLESVIANRNHNLETFEKFPQVLINVPVDKKNDLKEDPYATLIQEHVNMIKNGRIVVRYSGTENVLRVMTEDKNMKDAKLVANSLATNLQRALNEK